MASFFQGILQNVMSPSGSSQQGSVSGGGVAGVGGASVAGDVGGDEPDELALPDQCQQAEDTVESLRQALEKIGKRADKCLVRKQPEEALRDAFQQAAESMRSRSNLFDCVLDGLAATEQALMERRAELTDATARWTAGLRDRERRLAELQQERRNLARLAADLAKLRRRLGHALHKQHATGGASTDAAGELQLEVSTRENEERKERDAYIVRLNGLQGEKPAHCRQLLQLMQARLDYHTACAGHLQQQLPRLQSEVARITRLAGPCYGVPLSEHLARTGRRIAYVIDVCTAALKRDDVMDEEGLFRVNGPTSSVHKLESFLDVMQAEPEINRYDSASICGALKKYLKQLPEPLVGPALLPTWQKACSFASSDERRMALHACCSELRRCQPQLYDNLRHLVGFLALVCQRQDRNKMSPKNLGICIGPNIVGSAAAAALATAAGGAAATANGRATATLPNYDDLHSANLGTLIVENLIVHHEFCFGSDDATPAVAAATPLRSGQQQQQHHHQLRRDSERSLGAASFASSSAAASLEPGTPTNNNNNNNSSSEQQQRPAKFSAKSFHSDLYDTAFTLHALRSNGVAAAAEAAAAAASTSLDRQALRLGGGSRKASACAPVATAAPSSSSSGATAATAATHDFVKQARSIFEGHLLKSASLGAATSAAADSPRLTRFKDSKHVHLPSNLSIPPAQSPVGDAAAKSVTTLDTADGRDDITVPAPGTGE